MQDSWELKHALSVREPGSHKPLRNKTYKISATALALFNFQHNTAAADMFSIFTSSKFDFPDGAFSTLDGLHAVLRLTFLLGFKRKRGLVILCRTIRFRFRMSLTNVLRAWARDPPSRCKLPSAAQLSIIAPRTFWARSNRRLHAKLPFQLGRLQAHP